MCRTIVALLAALILLLPAGALAAERSPERAKHVVLVDWDGFDPSYLGSAPTPNLDALRRRGSLSTASSTFHTISNPTRASMATGAYPERHGNAAYIFDPVAGRAQGQSRFLASETIAESLAAAGKTTASVQWYIVQDHGTSYGDPEHLYVQPGGTFERRVDAAIEILNRRPVSSGGQMVTVPKIPDFLAVYSSDLDGLGHQQGPGSPAMPALLAEHDRQLGRLIQATKDVGIYEDTAFLLTADHGMTEWTRTVLPSVTGAIESAGYDAEVVRAGQAPAPDTEAIVVPGGRIGDVTLRGDAATRDAERRIERALEELHEVQRVHDGDDLRRLRASDKLGDLVVEARPPYAFVDQDAPPGESRGVHGSLSELEVPLFMAGAGIERGERPRRPGLVDIAPTIASLLGVRSPADAQGRALRESMSDDDDDDDRSRGLSMMTYNIHHAQGADDRLDLDRIAEEIRSQEVHVVGLQEVDRHWSERSEFVDQASYLADELGMHVVYGANLDQDPLTPGAPRRQYGTAILSRYPILESENTLLPKLGTSEQRGLLEALVNVRGTRYRVYNTHLQHNSPNAESGRAQRTMQIEAIVDEMREEREPHALVGDLNAAPADPEMQPLYRRLVDAWTAGGIGPGFTHSSTAPTRRIDYVFVTRDTRVEGAYVPGTIGSDHLPVVADVTLPRREDDD
jgi:endonuclease/exonuclease/phosphatase family metal-dependent hydrolase/arylsulfatase A-like enzyme